MMLSLGMGNPDVFKSSSDLYSYWTVHASCDCEPAQTAPSAHGPQAVRRVHTESRHKSSLTSLSCTPPSAELMRVVSRSLVS